MVVPDQRVVIRTLSEGTLRTRCLPDSVIIPCVSSVATTPLSNVYNSQTYQALVHC